MMLVSKWQFRNWITMEPKKKFIFWDLNEDLEPIGYPCMTCGGTFGACELGPENIEFWNFEEFDWNLEEYPATAMFWILNDDSIEKLILKLKECL